MCLKFEYDFNIKCSGFKMNSNAECTKLKCMEFYWIKSDHSVLLLVFEFKGVWIIYSTHIE